MEKGNTIKMTCVARPEPQRYFRRPWKRLLEWMVVDIASKSGDGQKMENGRLRKKRTEKETP